VTITLSQADYCHLWQQETQGQPVGDRPDPTTESVEVCPPEFGVGSKRWVTLREIDLLIHDYKFHRDVEVRYYPDEGGLEFGFQLQGGSYAQRCAGQSFVQNGPPLLETVCKKSGEHNLQIDLHLGSVDCLKSFLPDDVEPASLQVQQLLQASGQQPYRAHLRSFGICVKVINDVYFFSNHGLFQQFDRCRMGTPRTPLARDLTPQTRDSTARMELSRDYRRHPLPP